MGRLLLLTLLALGASFSETADAKVPLAFSKPESPPLVLVTPRAGDVAADGERYVVFVPYRGKRRRTGKMEVLDTLTMRRKVFAVPQDCYVNSGSYHRAVTAAGRALLFCYDDTTSSLVNRLLDLRHGGTVSLPPTITSERGEAEVIWFYVGRQWVEGEAEDGCHCAPYFNWRTGELRLLPRRPGTRDLDSPGLAPAPVCRGFGPGTSNAFRRYEHRRFVAGSRGNLSFDRVDLVSCGGRRRTLDPREAAISDVWLHGDLATWVRGDTSIVRAYDVRARRSFQWRPPHPARHDFESPAAITPARKHVVVSFAVSESCYKVCDTTSSSLYLARVRK